MPQQMPDSSSAMVHSLRPFAAQALTASACVAALGRQVHPGSESQAPAPSQHRTANPVSEGVTSVGRSSDAPAGQPSPLIQDTAAGQWCSGAQTAVRGI